MQKVISAERASNDSTPKATSVLLACGAVAGPLFTVVALIQIFTRPGFDLRRHDLSLLSNGQLGWINITTYVVAGLLAIAAAVAMRQVLPPGRGRTWGPLLIGIYGLGWVGAGFFTADAMNGFPPGTPNGLPASVSWHSWMHLISGSLSFLALIGACIVFARRFSGLGQRGWMAYSVATGVVTLAAVVGISAGSQQAAVIIAFFIAGVWGWFWVSALNARLIAESGARGRSLLSRSQPASK